MSDTIIISKSVINHFAQEGGKLIFKPEAETELLKLLELKDMVDNAIEHVKVDIEKAGKGISPDFTGVVGQRVRALYRVFGEKYTYDKALVEKARPYLSEFTIRKVQSGVVDDYVKREGTLPEGIIEKERVPKISLSIAKPQLDEDTSKTKSEIKD